jgi:pSer/pThr/pTyr-binding forkhead associated (FHA) protein
MKLIRLGIVVNRDPHGRCSQPVGAVCELPLGAFFFIGRHPDCDLVVDDKHVNRRNCRISCRLGDDGGWTVHENGGGNVWLNGVEVSGDHELEPGDVLTYGPDVEIGLVAL